MWELTLCKVQEMIGMELPNTVLKDGGVLLKLKRRLRKKKWDDERRPNTSHLTKKNDMAAERVWATHHHLLYMYIFTLHCAVIATTQKDTPQLHRNEIVLLVLSYKTKIKTKRERQKTYNLRWSVLGFGSSSSLPAASFRRWSNAGFDITSLM